MVTDRIFMIDPLKIKTYLRFGTDMGKFTYANRENYTYEWLEDTYVPQADTVTSGLASSSTTTSFTPATIALYQPGDVLLIDTEQIWVSAVGTAALTITRGFGSTTKATHANASTVKVVGRARLEADDADDSPTTEVSSGYNYTQILQKTIEVSRSKQKIAMYGIDDLMDREIDKAMDELMMFLNQVPYYGKRGAGSATTARSCGGLRTFITDNLTDASSAALTRKMIDDTLQDIWDDGGDPNLIICGGWAQRKINDFYEGFVQTDRLEDIGGIRISRLLHPVTGAELEIMTDRACPTNEMWILSTDHIAFYPFDDFFYEELAKSGDYEKGEVVGEYGLVVRADKHHGLVHTFSTSA
jgi:hypothetical protein